MHSRSMSPNLALSESGKLSPARKSPANHAPDLMATLNNEAVELNLYRIRKFGLRRTFSAFFSSCFLGARKPDAEIYRRALDVTQREPGECVFIDDRLENVESARQLGMHGLQYKDGEQLRRELGEQGIAWQPAA